MTAKRFKCHLGVVGVHIGVGTDEHELTGNECRDLLNKLSDENEQLKEEKEKWKSNCSSAVNENSILWNEISILREQGAEPSEAFNDYLNKKRGDLND